MLKKSISILLVILMILSLSIVAVSAANGLDGNITLDDGQTFTYKKGDVINYTVTLKADELFEDIECRLYYDQSVLELNRLENIEDEPYEFCPNLGDAVFCADDLTDELRFNSVKLRGFDFTTTQDLLKISFTVIGEGDTSLNLDIREMTLKGDTGSYFTKGEQVKFDGIEVKQYITGNTTEVPTEPSTPNEPAETENNIVLNDGTKYPYSKGDVIEYTVALTAEELFEDIECRLYYDQSVLSLNRLENVDDEAYEFCPNLGDAIFCADDLTNELRFNSVKLTGFNFQNEKVLLKLRFTVIGEGETKLDLDIREMTVKGGAESYFTKGEQVKFDGIEIKQYLSGGTNSEKGNVIVLDDGIEYEYQLGDIVEYTVSLSALEKFEDIEGTVLYNSNVLSLNRLEAVDDEAYEFFPNLGEVVINADETGAVHFNSIKLSGFDFRNGGDLVKLSFTVVGEGQANINLQIVEMTIIGNEESYFTDGVQAKTEGLEIGYNLAGNTLPPVVITKSLMMGDDDLNGKVNVKDATKIQKYLAEIETIDEDGLLVADVNEDGAVNVKDGTAIQKYTAKLEADNRIGEVVTFTIVKEQTAA